MSQKFATKTIKNVKKNNGFKKRVKIYGRAGNQLYKDIRYLKGLINSEPKYLIVQSGNNFNWAGLVVPLSNIVQGGSLNDRDGNMVLPRYLNINLLVGATFASANPQQLRIIVFRYWGESTGAGGSVTPSEILSTISSQFAPLSHLNDDNVGARGDRQRRIEVLKSETVSFDLVQQRETTYQYNFIMNSDEPKEHIKYNSATTAEPVSGGCYIMFISNNAGADGTTCKYVLESKLVFYDN